MLGPDILASKVGAGLIGASFNAASQYVQNGSINPVDVGVNFVTGTSGAYGGFWWNFGVHAAGGAANTAINNSLHNKNDTITFGAIANATAAGIGFGMGKIAEPAIGCTLRSTLTKGDLAPAGAWLGTPVWSMFGKNSSPAIGSSIGGGVATEAASSAINNIELNQKNRRLRDYYSPFSY